MYEQIKQMMNAYHQFVSYPIFADIQSLMPAMEKGELLLPTSAKTPRLTEKQLIKTFNNQWLNMSNTSSKTLAVNTKPRIGQGTTFVSDKAKDIFPEDSIVVDGAEDLMADYLAYKGDKATNNIYFSIDKNVFIHHGFGMKNIIPVNELFNRDKPVNFKSNAPASNKLQSRYNDAMLTRILDEVREKWQTFVFPVRVCHGLTSWQQDGWQKALKGDSND